MIHITMTKETIKIGTYQILVIGEFSLPDKVEVGQGMNKTIGEETLGAMLGHIKILEDRIVEENIELIIEMKIKAEGEVDVGLKKDHFWGKIIIEGIMEALVIADQDQVQEQVQIGTG